MKNYKITIIIPVYNGSKYIKNAFKYIKNQTFSFKNVQIVFVDDHSKDNSLAIMQELAKKYNNITVCSTPKGKKGPGAARNFGMTKAKAPFITFMDVDDYIHPQFFERTYKAINATKTDMVKVNHSVNVEGRKYNLARRNAKNIKVAHNDLTILVPDHLEPWATLYRFNLIKKNRIKFDEKAYHAEGFLFVAQCMTKAYKGIYFLPSYNGATWSLRADGTHAYQPAVDELEDHLKPCVAFLDVLSKSKQPVECMHRAYNFMLNVWCACAGASKGTYFDVAKFVFSYVIPITKDPRLHLDKYLK